MKKAVYSDNYYRLLALTYNPRFEDKIKILRQFFAEIGHPVDFSKTNNQATQLAWVNELRNKKLNKQLKMSKHKENWLLFGDKLKEIMTEFGLDTKNKNATLLIEQYFFTNELIDPTPHWQIGLNKYPNKSKALNNKLIVVLEPNIEVSDLEKALQQAKNEYPEYFMRKKTRKKEKDSFERDCKIYILHLKALKIKKSSRAANDIIWNNDPKYPKFNDEFIKITSVETVKRDYFTSIKNRMSKLLKGLKLY